MQYKKWTGITVILLLSTLLLSACKNTVEATEPPAADPEAVVAIADTFVQAISEGDHHRSYEMLSSIALNNVGSYAGWVEIAEPFKGIEWQFTNVGFSKAKEKDEYDNLAALFGTGSLNGEVVMIQLGLSIEQNKWMVEAVKFTVSN